MSPVFPPDLTQPIGCCDVALLLIFVGFTALLLVAERMMPARQHKDAWRWRQ